MAGVKETTDLEVLKKDAAKQSSPLVTQARDLKVTDEASYTKADAIRTKLNETKSVWEARLEKIIRPAYDVLQGLYSLKREIVKPIEDAIVIITASMKAYKIEERRRIAEEENKRRAEEERLIREKEAAQRKLEAAKTPVLAKVMAKQVEKIEEKAAAAKAVPITSAVKVGGSTERVVKKWRIVNPDLLIKAVAAGDIPADILEINSASFNDYFRGDLSDNKDAIRSWPGVEVYDDIEIVKKRGS